MYFSQGGKAYEKKSDEKKERPTSIHTNGKQHQESECQAEIIQRRDKVMIMKMYSIKDELNGYTSPIPFMNEELAKRYFFDQYQENPTINNSPKDFSLWNMGTFDTESGTFIGHIDGNKLVERAENYGK